MTNIENEMLEAYARCRLDGMTKADALAFLMLLDYKPTASVLKVIRTKDKYIFAFNQ